jgi:hypothetical protein
MHPALSDLSPRDSALWRVGRNLERFQNIEALLKLLLPTTMLAGTIQQIESQILENKRVAKKASLGTLTETYSRQILSPRQDMDETEVGSKVQFSVSHWIDAPPEVWKQMRSEWRRLTKERNQLVHSTLLEYNLDTNEGCSALCVHLDEQYERAHILIERLKHQAKARTFAASAFKQLHESGEFDRLLEEPSNDGRPQI